MKLLTLAAALLITSTTRGADLVVAAAADLKFAFDEIVADFQKQHTNDMIKVTYGSSGNFFAEIDNGAPFDLFLSADVNYPKRLIERKLASEDGLFRYAIGRIVLWIRSESPLDVTKRGVEALLDPSVRKIAIANPEHAPYGRAAVAAFKSLGVYEKIADKLVFGENISQTAQFVQSGAADAGLIALSLALAPKMKDTGRYWEVPANTYPKLEQGGVILSRTREPELARALRDAVTGAHGKEILRRYGFVIPE
jgi:molybdate transport system substrate-binding protein